MVPVRGLESDFRQFWEMLVEFTRRGGSRSKAVDHHRVRVFRLVFDNEIVGGGFLSLVSRDTRIRLVCRQARC